MKDVLRKLFPDKLSAESTTVNNGSEFLNSNDEVIDNLEKDENRAVEAYGRFFAHRLSNGMELNHNYIYAGRDLLKGNSILFNNPFYYDLIPYLFYPLNHQLLNHKKVLIVLGRHGIEKGIEKWCREGIMSVNCIPSMWSIGILKGEEQNLDIGILPRSRVHDLILHEANTEFLSKVSMMILIEPSKLMTTAQIGLNSLVRYCSNSESKPVFCSICRNCY